MRKYFCKSYRVVILLVVILTMIAMFAMTADASTGLNVDSHSKQEIRDYFKQLESSYSFTTEYDVMPVTTGPDYQAGKLSSSTLDGALGMLNAMRYIAGIPYDVQLKDEYNEACQAGTLLNAVNQQMSHSPSKPSDMSQELYNLGNKGCSSSNICWGYSNFQSAIVGWLDDGNNASGSNPGHRRWCLNPSMSYTGFGRTGTHSSMYAFDGAFGATSYSGVAWPAQKMPTAFFDTRTQWSISFGRRIDESDVTVKLVRNGDGETWNFAKDSSDGDFFVNNSNYGQTGCVVFKPTGVDSYEVGDVFDVTIKEKGNTIADYTVEFFDLYPVESILLSDTSLNLEIDKTARLTATVLPSDATDKSLTWTSSNSAVATVSSDGRVTAKQAGDAVITATDKTGAIKATCNVTVKKPEIKSISDQKIDLSYTKTDYTGTQKKPSVTISGLKEGTDYTVTYSNNINAGTATVTVTGKGAYSGEVIKNFTIEKKQLNKNSIVCKNEDSKLSVSVSGLTLNKDYTYSLDEAGNVIVKGMGNYYGEITILKADIQSYDENGQGGSDTQGEVTVKKPVRVTYVKLSTKTKHYIKATWKKVSCTGYQVRYSTSKSFKTYKSVYCKSNSKTIYNLKKGKYYYVKVRAYKVIDGKKVYGKFSTVKKIKCK